MTSVYHIFHESSILYVSHSYNPSNDVLTAPNILPIDILSSRLSIMQSEETVTEQIFNPT